MKSTNLPMRGLSKAIPNLRTRFTITGTYVMNKQVEPSSQALVVKPSPLRRSTRVSILDKKLTSQMKPIEILVNMDIQAASLVQPLSSSLYACNHLCYFL